MAKLVFSLVVNALIEKARRFSFCNYILVDVYKDFSRTLAETMETKFLTTHTYTNSLVGELYGASFDYKKFKGLPNYNVLEFAYNNNFANKILTRQNDLWEAAENGK